MQPGQHVTPTLRLVQQIGRGGMGSVWLADHLGIGTQVAIKFIARQLLQDEPAVQRFRREAVAAAQIKSPHVAQVFDHGVTQEGMLYIVMELLEGELLGKRVKRAGPLGLRETATVVTQVAKALTKAHQLGIIHRDIKPDNIFLTDVDGEVFVKVIDFGVAKQAADVNSGMTTTGSMVGTPLYMSPEQLFSAKHVDHRSDLWSLAVVAYHAMTGDLPFSGDTLGSLSVAVHTGVFSMPSAIQPGIPAAVDAWVQRALQQDPAHRFQSARELAETLERAVQGVPWSAWTSTSLPAVSAPAPTALGPSSGGVSAATAPSALAGSGAPLATGSYPSVAQGNVAMSTATHAGASRRQVAAIAVAAAIAAVAGATAAILLFRRAPSGEGAAGEGAAQTAGAAVTAAASAAPEAPPTAAAPTATASAAASAAAAPTASASAAPTASASAAPTATAWRSGVGGQRATSPTAKGKSPARPAPPKDTIGF